MKKYDVRVLDLVTEVNSAVVWGPPAAVGASRKSQPGSRVPRFPFTQRAHAWRCAYAPSLLDPLASR